VCVDEGEMNGVVLGCVQWGFKVTKLTGNIKRKVDLDKQKIVCPYDPGFKANFDAARDKWDDVELLKWKDALAK